MQARLLWLSLLVTGLSWAGAIPVTSVGLKPLPGYAQTTANWQPFESESGRFRVLLPGVPTAQSQADGVRLFLLEQDPFGYLVLYVDTPLAVGDIPESQAQDLLASVATEVVDNGRLIRQNAIRYGQTLAYETEYIDAENTRILLRSYWVGSRIYQVAGGAPGDAIAPEVLRFLNSFTVLDSNGVAINASDTSTTNASPPATEGTGAQTEAEADRLFEQGFDLFMAGRNADAIAPFQAALTLYRQLGNRNQEGVALYALGTVNNALGNYEAGIAFLQQAAEIHRALGNQASLMIDLNNLATAYDDIGSYDEALRYYQEALEIAQDINDRDTEIGLLSNIGQVYSGRGQRNEALTYYNQALQALETSNREAGPSEKRQRIEATLINNIGEAYASLSRYDEALPYYQRSLALNQSLGDKLGEAVALNNLAGFYNAQSQYPEALAYYEQSLAIVRSLNNLPQESIVLNNIGYIYTRLSDYPKALGYYEQSLEIAKRIGDRGSQASTLGNLGSIYTILGRYDEAQTVYQQQLEISRALGDIGTEMIALNNLGNLDINLGRYDQALQQFQAAMAIAQQIGEPYSQAVLLNNIGQIYERQSQYEQALDQYNQSLALRRQVNDRSGEALTLNNVAALYFAQSQYPQAIDTFNQALSIAQSLGDKLLEASTLSNMGLVYDSQAEYEQALSFYQKALDIRQAIGDRSGMAVTLNNIGSVYQAQGDFTLAFDYFNQVLAIAQELKDPSIEATVLNNFANTYDDQSKYPEAIDAYQRALALYQQLGNQSGQANTLSNLGATYFSQGQYAKALEIFSSALDIRQTIGDRAGAAITLNNIGQSYSELGQAERALTYLEQALAIQIELGNRLEQLSSLNNIGVAQIRLENYAEAQTSLQQAVDLAKAIGIETESSTPLANLGYLFDVQEQYEQAIPYYQQALTLTRAVDDRLQEATLLNNLGLLYTNLERYDEAQASLNQALSLQQAIGDRPGEGVTLTNLGYTWLNNNQNAQAIEPLTQAIAIWEALRPGLADREKVSLLDTLSSTYRHLQYALVEQNQPEAALEIAERGRSRAFVELLANRLNGNTEAVETIAPPNLAELQQVAREQQATLVEYSILDDYAEPKLLIWVIQPTGNVTFRQTVLPDTPIENLVSLSRRLLGIRGFSESFALDANAGDGDNSPLRRLHELLIAPIEDLLPSDPTQRVIFVPQGPLFLVPFAALQDEQGDYLIQHHTPLLAPSIQVLSFTHDLAQRRPASTNDLSNILIVGNPTMPQLELVPGEPREALPALPGAEAEARAIGEVLSTTPLIGAAATETTVASRMSQARIIHLASHGLLQYGSAEELGIKDFPGAIALAPDGAQDGLLTASEILNLPLQAELVVLSACNTGRGRITGDGVIGLSRSFIAAGVPSVLVSLWAVPDAPTAELMTAFYQALQTNPDKAQALRQAMLTTLEKYPNPRDWAAFALIGEAQ
jgi:tetratricopeptide (TPR) repeat protein